VPNGLRRSDPVAWVLEQLWAPIVAVTAAHDGRRSGLISSTALAASLLPEAPRLTVQLAKANLTHDLVLGSGALAVHLLPAGAVELFRALATRSGHDGDKLAGLMLRTAVTGSPIIEDALGHVEARVAATLDLGDATLVVADVVAGDALSEGEPLTIEEALVAVPPAELERRRAEELEAARRLRGG
jgi:flavin reductase (DIM6/NTAB) family NADH-FMN oxidoreductase RutF